jgi:hypothetical protein
MANTFVTNDMLNRSALKFASGKLSFLAGVDRQFDASFNGDGKHGSTLRIKNPQQFLVNTSRVANVQEITETSQTLTVNSPYNVAVPFTAQNRLQDIAEIERDIIEPAISTLIGKIEGDAISTFTKDIPNVVGGGSYAAASGFAPASLTDLLAVNRARAYLEQNYAPSDDRTVLSNSWQMSDMTNGLKGLFQDSTQIATQYKEGLMGRLAGANWRSNEKCISLTHGGDVAGAINGGTLTSGITSLTVNGFTAALTVGMSFTVDAIYDIDPITRASTGKLKWFVVTAATTTSISFLPAMNYDTSNPNQNCSGTPVTTAVITSNGSASTAYNQSLMFQKNAFVFVSAPLPKNASNDDCSVMTRDNLSIRVWTGSDIINDRSILRIDLLCGWKTVRPEFACKIQSP